MFEVILLTFIYQSHKLQQTNMSWLQTSFLNDDMVEQHLTSVGKVFQSFGPALSFTIHRFFKVYVIVYITIAKHWRLVIRPLIIETFKYHMHFLYLILKPGSQCRYFKELPTWSCLFNQKTVFEAAFWILWSSLTQFLFICHSTGHYNSQFYKH